MIQPNAKRTLLSMLNRLLLFSWTLIHYKPQYLVQISISELVLISKDLSLTRQDEGNQSKDISATAEGEARKGDVEDVGLGRLWLSHDHRRSLSNDQLLRLLLRRSRLIIGHRRLRWWSSSERLLLRVASWLRLLIRRYCWIQPLGFIWRWCVYSWCMGHGGKIDGWDLTKSM